LDAQTGKKLWTVRSPAIGNLDYGNSPRATPLIIENRVFLHGAFGYLSCVELDTGKVVWEINIRDEFDADDNRKWGTCASPIIAGGNLIINPGAKDASLVAINPANGKTVWKSAGKTAGYGSFIVGTFSGVEQIIGYDADTLGGWDPKTGKRLWTLKPDSPNDFNVPTPIIYGEKLIVSTENNGTRIFQFKKDGTLDPKPLATHRKLAPDTATPVLCGDRLFGVWRRLYCLDVKDNLKELYESDEKPFARYCAAVSDGERVLLISLDSELILLDGKAKEYTNLGKVKIFPQDKGVYAHPAFVGNKVYLRGESQIVGLELTGK